ncbi:MAG: carboxypeptidase-like regulatory domain-containing protein [Flavipsychrobacter sp.]|nr:carboxypeptidase-like regulatory domain-containing protein [Flavipsychrobacter sp.]
MRRTFTLLLLAFAPIAALAGIIKGKVTDDKGEGVPFAIVFVKGTTTGTSANANGEYQLHISAGTYSLTTQNMGYQQQVLKVTVKDNEPSVVNFKLKEQALEMDEVVIKDEDPAYYIIRNAIKRRKFHLQQVKSFQTSIYLKGVLRNREFKPGGMLKLLSGNDEKELKEGLGADSNGKGVLYLCEENAEYFSQGDKERTIIHSVKESGDPNGLGFSQMPPVITFYENNVTIISDVSSRGFVSPISENALNYYRYTYQGEFKEGDYTINKIKVTPRRKYEPLLEGTIYIVDKDWAIHSLVLQATKENALDLIDTLRIEQGFLPLETDTWVVKSQVIYPTIGIFGFNIAGYFVTVYDNQKVNKPIPDTIFNQRITSSYERDANKKDSSYWTESRPIPLEDDEVNDYVAKDSINKKYNDPAYRDSMRRKGNRFSVVDFIISGESYNTKAYKNRFRINPLLDLVPGSRGMVSYNTVEGINISPILSCGHLIDTGKYLSTTVATRYGVSNGHFNAIGSMVYTQNRRDWIGRGWSVGISGGSYVFQYNPSNPIEPIYNVVSTLLYQKNHMKLYERMQANIFFNRSYGNGLRWRLSAGWQERYILFNTSNFSWASSDVQPFTENIPASLKTVLWQNHQAVLAKASISYKPGHTYTQYPDYKVSNGSKWPLFSLDYEKGISGVLNSDVDFDKWRLGITDVLPLKLLGSLSYNIAAGGFLNARAVGSQDMMHLNGNQILLAAPYQRSFQNLPYYTHSNTEQLYGEAHLEYSMKGLLTNKIPLLRQLQWYFILGTNTFYASSGNYYTEAFVSIDNIGYKMARLFRVDFVQSWDSYRSKPSFAIRIGLSNLLNGNGSVSGDW